ncbi:MAG: exosortase E/protease, VPEID-CTERM system [Pseudomonadota bacterium]
MSDAGTEVKSRFDVPTLGGAARFLDSRVVLIGALAGVELVLLTLLYTVNLEFECQELASRRFCDEASMSVTRALLALSFVVLVVVARPARVTAFIGETRGISVGGRWLGLHALGFAVILLPWFMLNGLDDPTVFTVIVALWLIGCSVAAFGAFRYVAAPARWWRAVVEAGPLMPVAVLFGMALPNLALMIQPVWSVGPITDLTFEASVGLLDMFGLDAETKPAEYIVRVEDFAVRISAACSGVEGFVLITAFTLGYTWIFRDRLRFPMVLILVPLGLLLSWCFNVLRIAMLVAIGAGGAERLAAEGFHSHAGWLMFTALSLGLIAAAETVPAFQKAARAPRRDMPPILRDPVAAEILPFVAFMAAGLVLSTFTSTPALWYGVKVVAMAAAVWTFWPLIRPQLAWRPAFTAPALGLFVGIAWILAADPVTETSPVAEALAGLGPAALVFWIILRVAGTVALVPLVEEMFFRGYLMRRLSALSLLGPLGAVVVTSVLFAMLHSAWLLAGAAGVLFGWLVLRTGRVSDAVVAHLAANALIAAYAVATGNFDAI